MTMVIHNRSEKMITPSKPRLLSPRIAVSQKANRMATARSVRGRERFRTFRIPCRSTPSYVLTCLCSCELCKARKVKCDRQEPACGWCAKNNRVCIYKERKKPGLRASYGVELEDKINRMEAMLHVLGRRVEDHIGDGDCQRSSTLGRQADNYQASVMPPLSSDHHQDTPTTQYSWPVNLYSQQNPKQSDNIPIQPQGSNASHDAPSLDKSLASPSKANLGLTYSDDLPPYDQLCNLVDLYFKHINTWSPILDRKATFDILLGSQCVSASDQILLHAIVAVTLRFSKDTRLAAESRRRYYTVSKQKVQLYALEHPSIQAMQALALVTVDAFGTTNDLQSWNLLALLARNIIQLGLAVEKSVYLRPTADASSTGHIGGFILPQPETWTEDEGRRRLFWLTYIIDRYATISCHFDFVVDEKETDRPLPCRYDLFSKNQPVETRWFKGPGSTDVIVDCPENLGSFSYHCEVLRILSQIQRFLQNPVDIESVADVSRWHDTYRELDSKLSTWLAHLPGEYGKISQLCHSDPGSRVSNWIMIHAAFVTSVIRLHSVAAYPTSRSGLFLPSFNAVQRCLAAVESLRAIAQDVIDGGMLDLLGPPFAFSLWTSGRLLLVQAATMDCSVDPIIRFLISTLESMGKFWEVAKNWAGILSRLVQEGLQAEDDARQNQSFSTSKSYNSMRRTAHHLASLASRKPRSVLDPASTRPTSTNELEYLDVFDWFNYPRMHLERQHQYTNPQAESNQYTGGMTSGIFTAPNPESDWLNSKQPYDFKPPYE